MNLRPDQAAEIAKYRAAYRLPEYRMGLQRLNDAVDALRALPVRGSLLDVGCGRGEMLAEASRLGFDARGAEAVEALCDGRRVLNASITQLPMLERAFDVVTCFDVLEHVLHRDQVQAVQELGRVARSFVVIAAASYPSTLDGVELHVGRRMPDEWEQLFRSVLGREPVRCACATEQWVIDVR